MFHTTAGNMCAANSALRPKGLWKVPAQPFDSAPSDRLAAIVHLRPNEQQEGHNGIPYNRTYLCAMMREIRFFLDWGAKYPLWENGTDKYVMEPSDYGLSLDLDKALRSYMQFWNDHFIETDVSFEWDSSESKKAFDDEGDRLIQWLQDEVKDVARVRDERS